MKPSRFGANRNSNYARKRSVTMGVDLDDFNAMISGLEDDVEAAVRPAAQAGIQVLYEAVLSNVHAIGRKTGNLAGSIYQVYSREQSGPSKATYHVSWRTSDAALDDKGQSIRTGLPTAPHGHLIEFGHIQRYAAYFGDDGKWHTAVRPSMRGKELRRGATIAQKDAFYILRKGGPQQIAAKPFIRPAAAKFPQAEAAVRAKFFEIVT